MNTPATTPSAHIDAPWEVWDRPEELLVITAYGEPVAVCPRSNILDERVVRSRLELAADAPDFLTALRDLLDEAVSDEVHDHERTGCADCLFCRAKALADRHAW